MKSFDDSNTQLIAAMASECKDKISEWKQPLTDLPPSLQLTHLEWMCNKIETEAADWHPTKLHRWIGFVQCGMIANGILDIEGAKRMFDSIKVLYPDANEDLFDHLNSDDPFEVDIGGQG